MLSVKQICGFVYLSGLREGDRLELVFYINIVSSGIYILFQKQVQRSGGEFPMHQHRGSIASIDIGFLLSVNDIQEQ